MPTSTAAMPTRLWNAATSCGIAVIWILRAVMRPIPPPMTMARKFADRRQSEFRRAMIAGSEAIRWHVRTSVVATAIAMPIMPVRLPRRLLSGLDRPRSARMKQTPAIR